MNSEKRVSAFTYGISFLIFLGIVLWGKFFLKSGDEMGFVILNFYAIMPIVSLVSGFILGIKNGYLKWVYPVVFGVLGIIIAAYVFNGSWDLSSILFSFVPALFGLIIGFSVSKNK